MQRFTVRFLQMLLIALFMVVSATGPASAQSLPAAEFKEVKVVMEDGWSASGRHAVADDFVVVCPVKEVLDPSHPCSDSNVANLNAVRDFVLVCPVKEVLHPSHPCADRAPQIVNARPSDLVLVCPIEEVLEKHPCAETQMNAAKFQIAGDFVVTCPVNEVLEPGHPCAERNRR